MRFSIRDLLLVTVIVALVLGWWVDRQSYIQWGRWLERDRERAIWDAETLKEHLKEVGAKVSRDEKSLTTQFDYPGGGSMSSTNYFYSGLPAPNPSKE